MSDGSSGSLRLDTQSNGTSSSPSAIVPPARMSARRPPRCTRGRRIPGARDALEMGAWLREAPPDASTAPTRNRRPTSGLRDVPRVTTFRRARSHGRPSSSSVSASIRVSSYPRPGSAERATAERVAIAVEPVALRSRHADVDGDERRFGVRARGAAPRRRPHWSRCRTVARCGATGRAAQRASPPRSCHRRQGLRPDRRVRRTETRTSRPRDPRPPRERARASGRAS